MVFQFPVSVSEDVYNTFKKFSYIDICCSGAMPLLSYAYCRPRSPVATQSTPMSAYMLFWWLRLLTVSPLDDDGLEVDDRDVRLIS